MNKYILIDSNYSRQIVYIPCVNYYVVRKEGDMCYCMAKMYAFHSELYGGFSYPYPIGNINTEWATADEIFKDYI